MSNGRTFSNSRVDRAGETIRRTMRSPNAVELVHEDDYREALNVARTHRAEHSVALVTANNGLRSCLRTFMKEFASLVKTAEPWLGGK